MSQPEPEETVLNVKTEGSVTDGVFRIDFGVEDLALITMQFSASGADVLDLLIPALAESWASYYEAIIESYEEQVAAEQARLAEESK